MTKTTETTAAKIGRSMKKCEMRMAGPRSVGFDLRAGGWRRRCSLAAASPLRLAARASGR